MYDMHDSNGSSMEQSYACNSECENKVLCQQLADFSIECFEVNTLGIRASDTIPSTNDRLAEEVHVPSLKFFLLTNASICL